MSHLPQVPDTEQTSRLGILSIQNVCARMGHIWRETSNTDVGIDGEIELREGDRATGQILKVQSRAGASYLRNATSKSFDYYADPNQLEYWNRMTNPVILVTFDPIESCSYWIDIKKYLRLHPKVLTERPHKITFSKTTDRFDDGCDAALYRMFGVDDAEADHTYRQHLIERFSKLTLYSVTSDAPLAIDLERVFVRLTVQHPQTAVFISHHPGHLNDIHIPLTSELSPSDSLIWIPKMKSSVEASKNTDSPQQNGQEAISGDSTEAGKESQFHQSSRWKTKHAPILSVEEAIHSNRCLVIIGAPGAGKTTLLKYLSLKFARQQAVELLKLDTELLPLFVALRDFNRFLDNLERRGELEAIGPRLLPEFLTQHTQIIAPHLQLPTDYFERALDAGRCAVLLDGLDEVADPGKRARAAETAATFIKHYQNTRFVLTSRPRGYERESRQRLSALCSECHVRDFDYGDRQAFVTAWYGAVLTDQQGDTSTSRDRAQAEAADLMLAINANPKITALARNPLLLSVLAMVHQRGVGLPQGRAALYDECTDMLLGYWDQTKGGEAARDLAAYGGFDRDEKRSLLSPVALWFHEGGEARLEADGNELRDEIARQFGELFGDDWPLARRRADLFLQIIDERAGLIEERETGVYSFGHLTFQEYLAARSLADRDDYIAYTLCHLHESWWREVLLLQVGHLSSVRHFGRRARRLTTDLIQGILDAGSEFEDVLRRDLMLAARCLCDVGRLGVDDELRHSIFGELIGLWCTTSFSPQREEIEELFEPILATTEGQRFQDELHAALVGEVEELQQCALNAIQRLAPILAAPRLIEDLMQMLSNPAFGNDSSVAEALGAVLPAMERGARALSTDQQSEPWDKPEAETSVQNVTERLLLLTHHTDTNLQRVALVALEAADAANPSVAKRFLELTCSDDERVRDVAVSALGNFNFRRGALTDSDKERVARRLLEMISLDSSDPEGNTGYALGLQEMVAEDDAMISELQALTQHESDSVRTNACKALIGLKGLDEVADILSASLSHSGLIARFALARLLAHSSGEIRAGLAPLVLRLTHDEHEDIRQMAANTLPRAIPHLSAESVLERLLEMTQSSDGDQAASVRALGILSRTEPNPNIIEPIVQRLVEMLSEPEVSCRAEVASLLGDMGKAAATPQVLNSLFAIISTGAIDEDWLDEQEAEELQHTAAQALGQLAAADLGAAQFMREQREYIVHFWQERLFDEEIHSLFEYEEDGSSMLGNLAYRELLHLTRF